MRLAVVAAGFTPGRGRRAPARHDPPALPREAGGHEGAAGGRHGRAGHPAAAVAEKIFKQLLGFAGYGFPESHAASFALLVYASAWLKRYHPAVFAGGAPRQPAHGLLRAPHLVEDAKRHGVEVRGVDVQASGWESHAGGGRGRRVRRRRGRRRCSGVGLHVVRGLPREVGEAVVAARAEGPFASVADLTPAGRALPGLGHPARRGRGPRRPRAGAAGGGLEEPGAPGARGRGGRPLRRAGARRAGGGARALHRRRAGAGRLRHHRPLGAGPPHGGGPAGRWPGARSARCGRCSGSPTGRRSRWPAWSSCGSGRRRPAASSS